MERSEFRLLLLYLKRYFDLFIMFEQVDTGDDRRVNVDEFTDVRYSEYMNVHCNYTVLP